MALFKRPINDLFNLIQVSSLELSKQLLTKKYYNSRLYLSVDEYNTDDELDPERKLLWRRGDYQVGFNGDWDSVSDPRNIDPATKPFDYIPEIHTMAPFYAPQIEDPDNPGTFIPNPAYDGTKDPTNLVGKTRADGTLAVAPYYNGTANARYAFISLRGTISPTLGVTWERESVSGAVDGDNINFNLACVYVGRGLNGAKAESSMPTVDYDDPSANMFYNTSAADYDSSRDWSNIDPKKDTRTAPTPYADGDTIYIASGATELPAVPECGVNWYRDDTKPGLVDPYVLQAGEAEKLDAPKVAADTKGYRHDGTPVVYPYWNEAIYADPISSPDFEDTYDTESADYNPKHDSKNAAWNGGNYGMYFADEYLYDRTVVTKLPVCSEEDEGKTIIGFTNNSLSTPIALQLVSNYVYFKEGDTVYIPADKNNTGAGVEGEDWAKTATTDFPKAHVLIADNPDDRTIEDDMEIMSKKVNVEATMTEVKLPKESFAVDSLIMTVDFTRK